ncbi:MAG TPA: hypothetical protein HPP87_07195 [Planctomycetes bacterium]|nr:hypothetical protein [Planctomycetota bacterium]
MNTIHTCTNCGYWPPNAWGLDVTEGYESADTPRRLTVPVCMSYSHNGKPTCTDLDGNCTSGWIPFQKGGRRSV